MMTIYRRLILIGLVLLSSIGSIRISNASQPVMEKIGLPIKAIVEPLSKFKIGETAQFRLVYGAWDEGKPGVKNDPPGTIEVQLTRYGHISVDLPEKWSRNFRLGEFDTLLFSVTAPTDDTTGFRLHFHFDEDSLIVRKFIVTTWEIPEIWNVEPERMIADPSRTIRERQQYGTFDSLVAKAAKAKRDSLDSIQTGVIEIQSSTIFQQQRNNKITLETAPLIDSLFEIISLDEIRYIRFKGEQKFAILDTVNFPIVSSNERQLFSFLKLETREQIRIAARIVGIIPNRKVVRACPELVFGYYRVPVNKDIEQLLQASGLEMITFGDYMIEEFKCRDGRQ